MAADGADRGSGEYVVRGAAAAIVILAAGGSSRMGRPKPLLPIGGEPMLRRVVTRALDSSARPVLVVLGSSEDDVRPALDGLDCEIVSNPRWRDGQGTSVAVGVRRLRSSWPSIDAALFLLGDQPLVSTATIEAFLRARGEGARLAASERDGRLEAPALFSSDFFDELEGLSGDAGARAILRSHRAEAVAISLPAGEGTDIDTPEDYARPLL